MNPISVGAMLSGLGVILGAFGTHGLRGKIGYDLLDIFETGNKYLMIHAAAMILYGLWRTSLSESARPKRWPAVLFFVGITIFSGTLYAITFTGIRAFGMITPIGGLCLILGWAGFAKQAWASGEK